MMVWAKLAKAYGQGLPVLAVTFHVSTFPHLTSSPPTARHRTACSSITAASPHTPPLRPQTQGWSPRRPIYVYGQAAFCLANSFQPSRSHQTTSGCRGTWFFPDEGNTGKLLDPGGNLSLRLPQQFDLGCAQRSRCFVSRSPQSL